MATQLQRLPNKLKLLGYKSYQEYLKSSHWLKMKEKFFHKSKKIKKMIKKYGHLVCMICHSPYNLNIHHKSYQRIGKEYLGDLILICKDCHFQIHQIYKTGNWWKKGLWKLTHKFLNSKDKKRLMAKSIYSLY